MKITTIVTIIYFHINSIEKMEMHFPFILVAYYPGISRAKGGIPPIEHNIPLHTNNASHLYSYIM